MNPILILLLITVSCVFIIDLTDFVDSVKIGIWKWVWKDKREYRDFRIKPFDCSLCMSFWCGLIYLIASGDITLPLIVLQLFFSYMTPIIKDCLQMVKDICIRILDMLYTYLEL